MNNSKRLISLDAFRGFTIAAMILVNFPAKWGVQYDFVRHAKWNGITPADFIFPFFIFIVGVSIALSYTKQINRGVSKSFMFRKIAIRSLKIFTVGMLLRLLPNFDLGNIELPGVLQRIAFVFFISASLFLVSNWRQQAIIGIGILILYSIAMQLLPVPGIGPGVLEPGRNLAAWIDRLVIPASLLNKKGFDSDGLFSSFPAVSTCIAGMLTGHLLLHEGSYNKKLVVLLVVGVVFILAGKLWDLSFPINKKLWTSSFVLYTAGWAAVVFAISIWVADVLGFHKWAKPGIIFGSNAISIYVLADVFQTIFLHTSLQSFVYESLLEANVYPKAASLMWALFSVFVCYVAAMFLYRKKIFVKL
jgi:predicted acyltransferase